MPANARCNANQNVDAIWHANVENRHSVRWEHIDLLRRIDLRALLPICVARARAVMEIGHSLWEANKLASSDNHHICKSVNHQYAARRNTQMPVVDRSTFRLAPSNSISILKKSGGGGGKRTQLVHSR